MFFKKRNQSVRKCPSGHIMDPDWDTCPYCAGEQSSVFLDESRADQRSASPRGDLPPAPPLPPLPPPPSPSPVASHRAAPPPPPSPATSDPDVTQISRRGPPPPPPPPPARGSPPPVAPYAPLPPTAPAAGSGPPPLVEFTDARGRPASPPLPPPAATPHLPPTAPSGRSAPQVPGSLDEPTRILSAATGGGLLVAWLVAVSGPWRGQDFRIQPGGARVGRLPACGICLPQGQDLGLSKEHAEVRIAAGTCVLVDLGSANGTFVNDERITERALQDGDRVRFGLLEFVYKCLVL